MEEQCPLFILICISIVMSGGALFEFFRASPDAKKLLYIGWLFCFTVTILLDSIIFRFFLGKNFMPLKLLFYSVVAIFILSLTSASVVVGSIHKGRFKPVHALAGAIVIFCMIGILNPSISGLPTNQFGEIVGISSLVNIFICLLTTIGLALWQNRKVGHE